MTFEATLTVSRDGVPDLVTKETIVIPNLYVEMARRGFARPPVDSDGTLARIGKELTGTFRVRNVEDAAITFTERRLERHFCDPDLNPELLAPEVIDLSLDAHELREESIVLKAADFGANVCGVSVHLRGQAGDGVEMRASAHFQTPEPGFFAAPVTDPATLDVLNSVTEDGLVPDANRVTVDELERLKLEGRLTDVPRSTDIDSGALQSSDELGAVPDLLTKNKAISIA